MKVSQQDVRFIADFLNSLSSSADQVGKNIEKRQFDPIGERMTA